MIESRMNCMTKLPDVAEYLVLLLTLKSEILDAVNKITFYAFHFDPFEALSSTFRFITAVQTLFSVSLDSHLSKLSVQSFSIWVLPHQAQNTGESLFGEKRSERDWNVKGNVIFEWIRETKTLADNFIRRYSSLHSFSTFLTDMWQFSKSEREES